MSTRTVAALAVIATGSLAPAHASPPSLTPNVMAEDLATYRQARQSGGPGKDGIPSIDDPQFQSAAEADDYLDSGDRIIGIVRNGEARAYPQRILVWHEIVNDTVGGDSLAITYCPLTGTALGFHRDDAELGVSGKLVNSNLVMYDRATDTEYPQMLGTGIAGPLAGEGLEEVRVIWTEWGKWRERHPDTEVLTTDTGYMRNYDSDPYGAYNPASGYYAEDSSPIFPVMHRDGRYPAKYEIFGFRDADGAVAVDPKHLAAAGVIHHDTGESEFLIIHDPELETGWVYTGDNMETPDVDAITFNDDGPDFDGRADLTEVNAYEAMWFAWYAFYPDTELLDG